jgi:hypothetical protein
LEEHDSIQPVYECGTPPPLSPPSSLTSTQAFEMVAEKWAARWRLTEKAICEGVQSTTRYQNCPTPNELKRRTPKRQAPGAKGRRASASVQKSRQLLACSLSPHHTPDVNIGCSTTPEAGALGSLLPAYSHTDFGADALFCTNQANLFDQSFYQPSTLADQLGWLGDAEIGFAAYNGLFAQSNYQGSEGVIMPY